MNVPSTLEGRYEVQQEEVGRGGMGAVYRAINKNTGTPVAIKIILDASHKDALALFNREWRNVAKLQHGNIVTITDAGTFWDGSVTRPYFVMPFLHGKTLEQRVYGQSDPLSPSEVVRIIASAGEGLHYAHSQGIVHRDVKPSNIFVLEGGWVVIIDFGVLHLDNTAYDTTIKGTPPYLAPELVDPERNEKPSPRSDLFSLGTVCYEALTRTRPFERSTPQETVRALIKHRPVLAFEVNQLVSLGLSQVVHKAIAKDPAHRFESVAEFTGALQRAFRGEHLPEFDPKAFERQLSSVREALAKRQLQTAERELWRLEDVYMGPETSRLRGQLEKALITEEIQTAASERESGRYEEALRRVNKILEDHPGHEAAQVERDRIQSRILEQKHAVAETHMANGEYDKARDELVKASEIRPQNTATLKLLRDLKQMEESDRLLREEKENLFEEAENASRDGHVAAAIHKMGRLMELLNKQGSMGNSDRDTVYRKFYDDLLKAKSRANSLYLEAKQSLGDQNFHRALTICSDVLADDHSNSLFAGLKLEIEDADRRHRLNYVQEVVSSLGSIVDLDKKSTILQGAVSRYPGDSQLVDFANNVKERSELIESLYLSAKRLESMNDFMSALERWQIIKELHPTYPGLDIELQRIERRRDEGIRSERKAACINEIEKTVQTGDYEKANKLCAAAYVAFDGDREIRALESDIQAMIVRAQQSQELLTEAKAKMADNQSEEHLQLLRQAYSLDRNNVEVKQALVAALLGRADAIIASDLELAVQLTEEADALLPEDPAVANFKTRIEDYKERMAVEACLVSARRLARDGDLKGALREVRELTKTYVKNVRLQEELKKLERATGTGISSTRKDEAAQHRNQGSGDEESGRGFSFDTMPPTDVFEPNGTGPENATSDPLARLKLWSINFGGRLIDLSGNAMRVVKEIASRSPVLLKNIQGVRSLGTEIFIGLALVFVAGMISLYVRHPRQTVSPPLQILGSVAISATPAGAQLALSDGTRAIGSISTHLKTGAYVLNVTAPGFISQSIPLQINAKGLSINMQVDLQPQPISVRASSELDTTTVSMDNGEPVTFEAGSATLPNILPGQHEIDFTARRSKISVSFTFQPGDGARISNLLTVSGIGVLAIANHDGKSTIHCTCAPTRIKIDGNPQELVAEGVDLPLAPGGHDIEINGPSVKHLLVDVKDDPGIAIALFATSAPQRINVDDVVAQAQSLYMQKNYREADAMVSRALKIDSSNPAATELKQKLDRIRHIAPEVFQK